MKKRGQVAMEFLMTYGWAIIIILLAIGALWLLGVFSPSVPTTCQIEAPFTCQDAVVSDNSVILRLGANQVQSATVNSVTVNGQACPILTNTQLTSNQITTVRCSGLTFEEDEKITVEIDSSYSKTGGGLTHNIEGTVSGQASKGSYVYNDDSTLITAYDFEGDAKSLKSNQYDGTISGANCNIDGQVGNGCFFDGVDNYIDIGNLGGPHTTLSIETWARLDTQGGTVDRIFIQSKDTSPETGFQFGYGWGDDYYFRVCNAGTCETRLIIYTDEENWHHYAATFNAGDVKLYIDGVEVDQSTFNQVVINPSVTNTLIGEDSDTSTTEPFHGMIDELAVYNRVLTPDEILAHAKGN
ncbi:hypothetical protein CL622_02715 [archaeon]|nr:hypothetical protein [archaeon]|tara:strand:+ start:554 stop:1618 length:1065 start_codon:yes stop_codon:yes gene_type:complete